MPTRRLLMLGAAGGATLGAAPYGSESARANAGAVGIISGGVDGTYIRIAADLAAVLDDGLLRVLPIVGKGSVQNLSDIMFLRGVDLGIVQSDSYAYAQRERLIPGVAESINYIAKLYDEEVHILARREIARLEDLAGKPVNVDVKGSGTAMTAGLIFDALNIPVQTLNDGQDVGLQRLRAGQIAASIYVAGKPTRLFSTIGPDPNLHFLAIPPTAKLVETYLPAQLGHDSYPDLVPEGPAVETLAVGSVLAVFAWPPNTERHQKVARFMAALTEKFDQFQRPPRHPKWRDVNLAAQVPGWTRFAATAPAPVVRPRTFRPGPRLPGPG